MPLKAYPRGSLWWAKGRVEYNGRPITDYIRESTGASSERGANDWIADKEDAEIHRYLVGEDRPLTFNDLVILYPANPTMAKYLMPIVAEIGDELVKDISPRTIRDLGEKLYPDACTDTWRRWVITPARAVINNGHDMGKCGPIHIKGYPEAERVAQDMKRKKPSRIERRPGDWEWLLKFRQHASPRHAALALFMFATGARIGQSVRMHPDHHLDLQNHSVCVPGAKGSADRWITVPVEVVVELANIKYKIPRGWERKKENRRVFGWASKDGPIKGWRTACRLAKIEYLPPHSAGRHGFGQEMNVRQAVDEKAAGKFGGWSDTGLMRRTYTHAEDVVTKIHAGFRTGLVQAENQTGIKLLKDKAK